MKATLFDVMLNNEDSRILEAVFSHDLSPESLETIASRSRSSRARMDAVLLIDDKAVLNRLATEVEHPHTRWFAGRRVNLLPINSLHRIIDTAILLKAATCRRAQRKRHCSPFTA